jgi:hypothetical protein
MTDISSPDPHTPMNIDDIPSPCINVCNISPDTGWCEGCFRTLDEIAGWRELSSDGKLAVLSLLTSRRPRTRWEG